MYTIFLDVFFLWVTIASSEQQQSPALHSSAPAPPCGAAHTAHAVRETALPCSAPASLCDASAEIVKDTFSYRAQHAPGVLPAYAPATSAWA